MEQSDLLRMAIATLERLEVPYAIVGSFASSAWGESRFTQDIAIVIRVDQRSIEQLCDAFSGDEFYVSRIAAQEAVKLNGQFNILNPESGNKIDFMIAGRSKRASSQLLHDQVQCKQKPRRMTVAIVPIINSPIVAGSGICNGITATSSTSTPEIIS